MVVIIAGLGLAIAARGFGLPPLPAFAAPAEPTLATTPDAVVALGEMVMLQLDA